MRPNDEVQDISEDTMKEINPEEISSEELYQKILKKMPEEIAGTPEWKRKVQVQAINDGK